MGPRPERPVPPEMSAMVSDSGAPAAESLAGVGAEHEAFQPQVVSVVIPAYNAEQVLPTQLQALGRQTYRERWEVIVADNGSSDQTRQVAESYREQLPSLIVVDASRVRGPSHARNIGAQSASGDLLLFCDADDLVHEEWVAAMVAASTDADLLAGPITPTRDPEAHDSGLLPADRARPHFGFLPWNTAGNLAVRRAVFDHVGGFDEHRRLGEDVEFCWRVQLTGYRFRFVPEAHVTYRLDSLRRVAARQYAFGREAPGLYEEFSWAGAPRLTASPLLIATLRAVLRAPWALRSRQTRLLWITSTAGLVGRWSGLLRLRRSRQ